MTTQTDDHFLVLGASGKTGRRVAERLTVRGLRVRGSHRGSAIPFQWEDANTWYPALEGVTSIYLSYSPDLAVPGAADVVRAFSEAAVSRGVRRVVLLSGRGEPGAEAAELAVREAKLETTIVRASWFNQNFSEGYLLEPVLDGTVRLPVGTMLEPFIDADDIADVAVAALTGAGHAGNLYEVTGPRLLSFGDAIADIAAASGRDIAFETVAIDDYAAALAEYEVPGDVIWLMRHLFTEVLDGRNAHVTDGVERALGRPARDFSDYARSAAASGIWGAPARLESPL